MTQKLPPRRVSPPRSRPQGRDGVLGKHPEPGPPLPPVVGVTHRFVDVGDVRLHVAEAGAGTPLLLLHGEPQHWYAWRHIIPRVADRYRVICPDLRGMGWSDAPPSGYRKDQMATDVLGLIDALDLDGVRLAGHDYGGIVGFLLCLRAPERISRFLALNTYHPWLTPRGVLANLPREWYQLITMTPRLGPAVIRRRPAFWRFLMRAGLRDTSIWAPGEIEHYAEHVRDPSRAEATSQLARTLLPDQLDVRRRYARARLQVPTRMLLGDRDFAISPRLVHGWRRHAEDMTVEVLPETSHWLLNERPDRVVEEIRTFLR